MKNDFLSQLQRQSMSDETRLPHMLTPTANVFCQMDTKCTGAVCPGTFRSSGALALRVHRSWRLCIYISSSMHQPTTDVNLGPSSTFSTLVLDLRFSGHSCYFQYFCEVLSTAVTYFNIFIDCDLLNVQTLCFHIMQPPRRQVQRTGNVQLEFHLKQWRIDIRS
jgi:hypothetical protein